MAEIIGSSKDWEEMLESQGIAEGSQAYVESGQPMSKAHAEWLSAQDRGTFDNTAVELGMIETNEDEVHRMKEKFPGLGRFFSTKSRRSISNNGDWDNLEPSNAWLEPTDNTANHEIEHGSDEIDIKRGAKNETEDAEPITEKSPIRDNILWKTYKRPYRHLDDILAAKPDLPSGTTIMGLLHLAESLTKQADTFLDNLERPDLALQEWAKVTIIVNGTIPHYDGYSSLMSDLGLLTRYNMIKKWLIDQHAKFEEAKEFIRNDNYRHGVVSSLPSPIDWPDRENGASSSDSKSKRSQNGDGIGSNKEDIVAGSTSDGAIVSEGLSESSNHSMHSQSSSQNFSDNFTISYPCHIITCPDHQSGFSSQETLVHHYELVHGESYYLCDYPSCQSKIGSAILPGSRIKFLRCDFRGSKQDYKYHLRSFHKEDISTLSSKLSDTEIAILDTCRLEVDWWRCQSCLRRVLINNEGYTCKDCKAICEHVRITTRKTRFGVGSLIGSGNMAQVTPGTVFPTHNQHPNSSIVGDISLQRTSSSENLRIEQNFVDASLNIRNISPRKETVDPFERVDKMSAMSSRSIKSEPCINIEFTHTEYTNFRNTPFTTVKQLGHGSLGTVDAVRIHGSEDEALIARKIIRLPNFSRKKLLPLIQQEVAVLRGLTHQHIVKVVSTYETTKAPRQFGILISPAGDEDLGHFLERVSEGDFPEEDIKLLSGWQCCLASAVAYIHSQSIRHKDIKPNNIICKGDQVYLTDFGSAHQFSAGITSSTEGPLVGITKMYSAPEVIADDRRGRPADVYSLGCVFAEMATVADGERIEEFHEYRSQPIPDEPDRMTYAYHATAHMIGPWFTELGDSWTASLLQEMLAVDQKCRPTADVLVETLLEHYGPPNCSCHLNSSSKFLSQVDGTTTSKFIKNSGQSPSEFNSNLQLLPRVVNKQYVCMEPKHEELSDNGFLGVRLGECETCKTGWLYARYSDAIAHLKKSHFGLLHPEELLRPWVTEIEEDATENEAKIPPDENSIVRFVCNINAQSESKWNGPSPVRPFSKCFYCTGGQRYDSRGLVVLHLRQIHFSGESVPLLGFWIKAVKESTQNKTENLSFMSTADNKPIEEFFDNFICFTPSPGTWNGPDPSLPLANCSDCLTPRQWGSLDAAVLHLSSVHFVSNPSLDFRPWVRQAVRSIIPNQKSNYFNEDHEPTMT
ncbi:hypothetical protein NHQ30_001348 [Ciborinia camelliae]|nr:hypothetical protein NHQ30_001348 [Ciborinia camelliae]